MLKKYAKLDAQNVILGEELLDSNNLPAHKAGRLKQITEIVPTITENEVLDGFEYTVEENRVIKLYKVKQLTDKEYFLKRVPKGEVALWAFKAVAKLNGYLNELDILISQLPEPEKTIAESQWNYATVIEREHPTTVGIGAALGLTPTEIDNMFLQAKQIQGY